MALTTVKAAGIAADSIDETKIADNGIDSEHYNDGSIDHAHLANDCVDGDNLADNACDSEHYTDGSIDHVHLADDAVDGDNIADNSVGLAHMAGGTDGVIITYDASGNPVHVGPGNDGQVLTSTGAGSPPAFEDVPAGGATINNATENELVTVASTTTQLDAETKLTFDGSKLLLAPRGQQTDPRGYIGVKGEDADVVAYVACGFNAVGNTVGYYFTCHDVAAPKRKAGIVLKKTGDYGKGDIEFWIDPNGDDADVASGDLHTTFENNGDIAIDDGNLVVASGHGIDFSATSDGSGANISELLDDYEEGTWTPTLTSSGTDPSVTYTNRGQGGGYVKVGAMVTCWYYSEISAVNNTPSGTLRMSGLPFQAASAATGGESASMAGWMRVGSGATGDHVEPYWRNVVGTSYLLLQYRNDSDGSQSNPQAAANLPSNYFSIGTICYRTDS